MSFSHLWKDLTVFILIYFHDILFQTGPHIHFTFTLSSKIDHWWKRIHPITMSKAALTSFRYLIARYKMTLPRHISSTIGPLLIFISCFSVWDGSLEDFTSQQEKNCLFYVWILRSINTSLAGDSVILALFLCSWCVYTLLL